MSQKYVVWLESELVARRMTAGSFQHCYRRAVELKRSNLDNHLLIQLYPPDPLYPLMEVMSLPLDFEVVSNDN